MVLPEPGFHAGLRELTRRSGSLLLIDETHTISSGLGGYTRAHGLEPDLFVLGKPIAGGVPASIWGMSADIAERYAAYDQDKDGGLFRHGHHAFRQPAAVRGDARHAGRGDDERKTTITWSASPRGWRRA